MIFGFIKLSQIEKNLNNRHITTDTMNHNNRINNNRIITTDTMLGIGFKMASEEHGTGFLFMSSCPFHITLYSLSKKLDFFYVSSLGL